MIKYIICGEGNFLKYVTGQLINNETGQMFCTVEDVGALRTIDQIREKTVIIADSWHLADQWISTLKALGVNDIYRIPIHVMQHNIPLMYDGKICFDQMTKITDCDLLYLETHVADTCNLKCKGCMHFSNLATSHNFPDLDLFEKDFVRLSELFGNIYIIRLLGGEPLLNKDLPKYVDIVRKYFPTSEIRITTNGLLIPRQDKDFWKSLRKYRIGMDISPYPPTMDIISQITGILDEEGIPYGNIAEVLNKFRKSLTLHPTNSPEKSVKLCASSHCHFLRNGKISKCPLPVMITDFNKHYPDNKIVTNDTFDIYEEKSGRILKDKLEKYAEMCRYCPDTPEFIKWERTNNDAKLEDWVIMK